MGLKNQGEHKNDDIDEDAIKENMENIEVETDLSELAQIYSYPCAGAQHITGANEDTRYNVSLFIFTDVYCFLVEASVAADSFDDYEERILNWFRDLKFVN